MTTEQLAAERAAFEAWYATTKGAVARPYPGSAWDGWLAAKEHAARERALDELVAHSQAIGGYDATADGMLKP